MPDAPVPSAEAVRLALNAMREYRKQVARSYSSGTAMQIEMASYTDANPEAVEAALTAALPFLHRQWEAERTTLVRLAASLLCELGRMPDPRFAKLKEVRVSVLIERGPLVPTYKVERLTDDQSEAVVAAFLAARSARATEGMEP